MTKPDEHKWNDRQRALIEALADVTDTRSKEDRAVDVGYSLKYVYALQHDDRFVQAVRNRSRQLLGLNLPRVYAGLVKAAAGGDVRAAELLLKACGEIESGGAKQVVNVNQNSGEDFTESLQRLHESTCRLAEN